MNDAEDKVLEHALREVFHAEGTDLPHKVLHTLRGSRLTEVPATHAGPTPRRYRWLAAAAALVLALLWALDGLRGGSGTDDPVVVATSELPLDVFSAGDPETRSRSSFRAGQTLVNGPLREQRVTLSSGESITLGRCSMLTIDRDGPSFVLSPMLGGITVQTHADSNVRVRTSLGTVAIEERGELQVELLAEGYGLENPEPFRQLAKELHMKTSAAMILTLVTVVEGSALLENEGGPRPLIAGETLQDPEDGFTVEEIDAKLLEAVGTWDLTMTEIGRDGTPGQAYEGTQVCRAGPGDKWLIDDMKLTVGERTFTLHIVVGYNPAKRRYAGTLFDSFGGEPGLLRGEVGDDLDSRTLSMYSGEGTPGFDVRWHMRWESTDLRRTKMEALVDEEWLLVREIVHRRRKQK